MVPNAKEQPCRRPVPTPRPSAPKIGQIFNPHRDFCGFYPPDIIARLADLTDGPKRLYDRAVRWAGRNGSFWYSFETMAVELGKCPRQVKRDMGELERRGFLTHRRRGKRQSDVYKFLYHPSFESDGTSMSLHPDGDGSDSTCDGTSTSLGEVTSMTPELCKRNFINESSSTREVAQRPAEPEKQNDDDDLCFSENISAHTVELVDPVTNSCNAQVSDPLMVADPLPRAFLETIAAEIHFSKCCRDGIEVDLSSFRAPDIAIVTRIVEPWRGKGTGPLREWISSTIERGLGRKSQAAGTYVYGLFLSDSAIYARDWRPNRPAARKQLSPTPPCEDYTDARDYLRRITNE